MGLEFLLLFYIQCFGSGFDQIRESGSGFGIRIRMQEGKNDSQKLEKSDKIFPCSEVLDVLFWGLMASVAWMSFMEA